VGYSFDSTGSVLTINAGSLAYNPAVAYQFTIETIYMSKAFSQVISVQISSGLAVPVVTLGYKSKMFLYRRNLFFTYFKNDKQDVVSISLAFRMQPLRR
jgi:hypothetical protein